MISEVQLVRFEFDGRFGLTMRDVPDPIDQLLQEHGLGGGHTWVSIVDYLISAGRVPPRIVEHVVFGCEGDELFGTATGSATIDELEDFLRDLFSDAARLRAIVSEAGDALE